MLHLEASNAELETRVSELEASLATLSQKEQERRNLHEARHAEEVAFLKKKNQQLKTQLDFLQSSARGT